MRPQPWGLDARMQMSDLAAKSRRYCYDMRIYDISTNFSFMDERAKHRRFQQLVNFRVPKCPFGTEYVSNNRGRGGILRADHTWIIKIIQPRAD